MKKVLETVLKNGAVIAEPGEFTKRAFLNGRLDLSQAEAVMDVIQAKNTEVIDADRQGKSPYDFSQTVTAEITKIKEKIDQNSSL